MNKEEIKQLVTEANKVFANVAKAIRILTAGNPLVLFTREEVDKDDNLIYEMPSEYYVNKYEDYLQGAVRKVEDNDVTLFLMGEDFGDEITLCIDDLPFGSQIDLLERLEERYDEEEKNVQEKCDLVDL
jgi:hypothetical protein